VVVLVVDEEQDEDDEQDDEEQLQPDRGGGLGLHFTTVLTDRLLPF